MFVSEMKYFCLFHCPGTEFPDPPLQRPSGGENDQVESSSVPGPGHQQHGRHERGDRAGQKLQQAGNYYRYQGFTVIAW